MNELITLLVPIVKSQPFWAATIIVASALGGVFYMRLRGASIEEHVSISKATLAHMQVLVDLNENFKQQIVELQRKVDKLEAEVKALRSSVY